MPLASRVYFYRELFSIYRGCIPVLSMNRVSSNCSLSSPFIQCRPLLFAYSSSLFSLCKYLNCTFLGLLVYHLRLATSYNSVDLSHDISLLLLLPTCRVRVVFLSRHFAWSCSNVLDRIIVYFLWYRSAIPRLPISGIHDIFFEPEQHPLSTRHFFVISITMLIQSIFVATLLSVADATCMGHLHRRAAENNTVEVSKFGYSGQVGPLLWQTLGEENSVCEKGENQSPINIGKLPSSTFRHWALSADPSNTRRTHRSSIQNKSLTCERAQIRLSKRQHLHRRYTLRRSSTQSLKISVPRSRLSSMGRLSLGTRRSTSNNFTFTRRPSNASMNTFHWRCTWSINLLVRFYLA